MSRTAHFALSASIFLLALTGCRQQADSAGAQAVSGAKQDAVPAASSSAISVQPATVSVCGSGVVATVHWDASAVHADTTTTQIWTGTDAAKLKLFSEGGAKGETQTGPWTEPGTRFVLKNKDDGKVLGNAMVGGPKCP